MLVPESDFEGISLTATDARKNTRFYREDSKIRIVIEPGHRKNAHTGMKTLLEIAFHLARKTQEGFPAVEAWEGEPNEGGFKFLKLSPEVVEDLLG